MQKIRRFFSCLLVLFLLFGIFSPLGASFAWKDVYDYREYVDKINISNTLSSVLDWENQFSSPRTTFIMQFQDYKPENPEDIEVIWKIEGREVRQFLDRDEVDDTRVSMTFPYVTDARTSIAYTILFHTSNVPTDIALVSSFHGSIAKKLTFDPKKNALFALEKSDIVTRAEWWADETLRYVPTWKREQDTAEWITRWKIPHIIYETQAEHDNRIQVDKEYAAIVALDPAYAWIQSVKRYEWIQKLTWPIRKAKKVDRIVIHHTAENLDTIADDATLLRAIYFYHTKKKWWGDIGYNYLVWQRGKIYEWRAGGDYVEWAHAYGNNTSTVGISVIGNYESLHLNKEQKSGLLDAIEYVARKYGINVDEKDYGASLCAKSAACTWYAVSTPRLIAHRDVTATSCAWRNIYTLLPELRNTIVWKVWKVSPVYNFGDSTIDPVDPIDSIEYRIKTTIIDTPKPLSGTTRIMSSWGKPIKIKLSYPHESLTFESAGMRTARLSIDGKTIPYIKWDDVKVEKWETGKMNVLTPKWNYTGSVLTFSTDVFRISSWSRVPTWDNAWKYNDNIFRAKLIVRNEWWKLLVINELPIEDYLKWLGEVTDRDELEKMKTIHIAARTYAYFYIKPENRKFSTNLYDLNDDPASSQEYKWYWFEIRYPKTSSAVKMTKWKVISYKWELIKSWYFSLSDGRTLSYKAYCESRWIQNCVDIPYLQSVDDPAWVWKIRSGHGVGISGIGATYAASLGKKYGEIIAYYMSGASIMSINQLK